MNKYNEDGNVAYETLTVPATRYNDANVLDRRQRVAGFLGCSALIGVLLITSGCGSAVTSTSQSSTPTPESSHTIVMTTPTPTLPGWALECTSDGQPLSGITGPVVGRIIPLPYSLPKGDKGEIQEVRNGGANFFSDRNATTPKGTVAPCEETDVICRDFDPNSQVASAHGYWYLMRKKIGNIFVEGWIAANTFWNKNDKNKVLNSTRPDTDQPTDLSVRECSPAEVQLTTFTPEPSPATAAIPIAQPFDRWAEDQQLAA